MTRKEHIQKAAMEHASYQTQDKGIAYLDFVRTAEWADRTMIEKDCEWISIYYPNIDRMGIDKFITVFRKATEE